MNVLTGPPSSVQPLEQQLEHAVAAFQSGDAKSSEAICLQILDRMRGHSLTRAILGLSYHTQGRFAEAVRIFEGLLEDEPLEPAHWINLGTARRCAGRYDEALAAYARAAQLVEPNADFYYNIGLTHLARFDYESARAVLARAVELAPRDAEIRFEYAKACFESLHPDEAVAALKGWEELEGLGDTLIADIGQRLMNLGESDAAEATIRRLSAAPNLNPHASLTLAQILERTNRVTAARMLVDRLLANPAAVALGSDLQITAALIAQRESKHDEAVQRFQSALDSCSEFHQRHALLFSQVKSLDALHRHDEAYAALEEAHRSQLEHFKLTAPLVTARGAPTMQITRHGCDPEDVATWTASGAPSADASPIFIVAFPRSGTTLLELTLDAHPTLRSMDEQPFLHQALDDLLATGHAYPRELGKVSPAELERIRERYWTRVREKVTLDSGQRLVDKNPLNLLRLPVIRRVFPNARIILAIRHPFDVLLSCFMQHFRAPDFALLCVDLPTLADAYRRSFDFWYEQHALLRPAALEVRYETLVDDFETQARGLTDFLELPWSDALLEPGRHAAAKGYISTPSYSQVVQPINKKSVARWRNYARQLEPVRPIVEPYLKRWHYDD